MGRFYSGDIEGKFWFAVQPSDDASFFGGTELEPSYIEYSFDEDDLPSIREGIKKCTEALGEHEQELKEFFEKNNGYNHEMIVNQTSILANQVDNLLMWYARKELGVKILKCVEEQGSCEFEAEL